MITSEELSEKFSNTSPKKTTIFQQRGSFQPIQATIVTAQPTSRAQIQTPMQSPAEVTVSPPIRNSSGASSSVTPQHHTVTQISTRKLPHPPQYKPSINSPAQPASAVSASPLDELPKFTAQQDTIPRSLAFKFMRWMRLGQDVIHIEAEEEEREEQEEQARIQQQITQKADVVAAAASDSESTTQQTDASLAATALMLDKSTLRADGEIEHAALREAASTDSSSPLEEVVEETKNRWRSFGRRAVAKTVLPLIEYSAITALKSFKKRQQQNTQSLTSASASVPALDEDDSIVNDYDPEVIEATVDSLLEDVKKSRRISKKSMLKSGAHKKLVVSNDKRYIDNIQSLYGVGRDKAAEMIRSAIEAAKSDPKGPKIVELHDSKDDDEVFGVKIRVEGGPAISFAPTDIHERLKPYIQRS